MESSQKMDFPSNGVSILGCLRPAFMDEELYLRRLFNDEDSDGYSSDWKGIGILKIFEYWDAWSLTSWSKIFPFPDQRRSLFLNQLIGLCGGVDCQDIQLLGITHA
ncbi:hypothetical protein U1Q18_030494 [Sarracenia purpurea var. burkii]